MPLLFARKEVFEWLKQGKKTIDVRKGTGKSGDFALFQCGPHTLRFIIVKREVGTLGAIVRLDNYLQIIPTAEDIQDAIAFFQKLYGECIGFFTAYYIQPLEGFAEKEK